jgi:hypothetical protein
MVAYSFKARFVAPICVGLGIAIPPKIGLRYAAGTEFEPKCQTIRAIGLRRHAMGGEELQLYCAQRTKQCFLIGRPTCTKTDPIYMKIYGDPDIAIQLGDKWLGDTKAEKFARADGFGSIEDMWLFWREEHAGVAEFAGSVIQWKGKS